MSAMRVLSLMSGAQAQEMRDLEREYEKVLDANCIAYALYLKKILETGDAAKETYSPPPPPPELVFGVGDDDQDGDVDDETTAETDEAVSSQNDVRYNVMLRTQTYPISVLGSTVSTPW